MGYTAMPSKLGHTYPPPTSSCMTIIQWTRLIRPYGSNDWPGGTVNRNKWTRDRHVSGLGDISRRDARHTFVLSRVKKARMRTLADILITPPWCDASTVCRLCNPVFCNRAQEFAARARRRQALIYCIYNKSENNFCKYNKSECVVAYSYSRFGTSEVCAWHRHVLHVRVPSCMCGDMF